MDGIPLGEMNTSMTINATAAWLLALYIVAAEDQGVPEEQLQGTTQNDIIKEFLARGTYAFPPAPSMRLIADMIAYTVEHVPKWNPINICSYHLQEAGATPGAGDRLRDEQRDRRARRRARAGAGGAPGTGLRAHLVLRQRGRALHRGARQAARDVDPVGGARAASATASQDPRHLRFRYGVQVNSLGLTEAQPENNVQRIVLEALAVTLGRDARARAIQLPAWNEALGLPRPWDQQWSLRIQQVLAYETDILEYPDIFEGSKVMDGLVAELLEGARAEMAVVAEHGGAVEAVPYMKAALVDSHRERIRRIEAGEQVVVGPEPLHRDRGLAADRRRRGRHPGGRPGAGSAADRGSAPLALRARPGSRRRRARARSPRLPRDARRGGEPDGRRRSPPRGPARRPASGRGTLREVFGSYRAPTGVGEAAASPSDERAQRAARRGGAACRRSSAAGRRSWSASRVWTATPTAPSRSPCARATRAWTSSTRASA